MCAITSSEITRLITDNIRNQTFDNICLTSEIRRLIRGVCFWGLIYLISEDLDKQLRIKISNNNERRFDDYVIIFKSV